MQALVQHAPQCKWPQYRAAFTLFLKWTATATEEEKTETLHSIRGHLVDFGNIPIATMTFTEVLDVLGGPGQVKPMLLRVPLHHWLASWAARRAGGQLALQKLTAGKVGDNVVPATCPLSGRGWQVELQRGLEDASTSMQQYKVQLEKYIQEAPKGEAHKEPEAQNPAALAQGHPHGRQSFRGTMGVLKRRSWANWLH